MQEIASGGMCNIIPESTFQEVIQTRRRIKGGEKIKLKGDTKCYVDTLGGFGLIFFSKAQFCERYDK